MMDWLQTALGEILNGILLVLPDSPFRPMLKSIPQDLLGGLNWMFGFGDILTLLVAWIACVGIYYIVVIILRWIKAVES